MALPPHLTAEWHPTKNGSLTADAITHGSKKKVWWQKDCASNGVLHEWEAAVYARSSGNGCAVCNNRQVQMGVNDLASTHSALAAEWHPDNALTALDVTAGYRTKVLWLGACGHVWSASPQQRSRTGSGCPACSASGGRALPGVNDLATTHPALAIEWHPDNDRPVTAVTFSSKYRARWIGACGHEWTCSVASRGRIGNGCPKCAGQAPEFGATDLVTTHPELHAELHPTRNTAAGIDVSSLMKFSNVNAWWLGSCGHEWTARVSSRADGIGCPVCDNKKIISGINDLATVRPDLLEQWHTSVNSALDPTVIAAGARRLAWWRCPDGHEWEAQVYSVSAGSGCPTCARRRSRIELAFLAQFESHFGHVTGSEKLPVPWTSPVGRTYQTAEVDIFVALPDGSALVVEYDGERWHRDKPATDVAKTRALLAAGHRVARIRETPLEFLPLTHPHLLQTSHTNGSPLEPTVFAILDWLAA